MTQPHLLCVQIHHNRPSGPDVTVVTRLRCIFVKR